MFRTIDKELLEQLFDFSKLELETGKMIILGIRMNNIPNKYNDFIGLIFKGKQNYVRFFPATTIPGTTSLKKLMNKKGTAILPSGYYKDLWKKGKHKGEYNALVQNKAVALYRDNDLDEIAEFVNLQKEGLVGINLHRANQSNVLTKQIDIFKTYFINGWSAGCQVIASKAHFDMFMWFVNESKQTTFDYYLVDNKVLKSIKVNKKGEIINYE